MQKEIEKLGKISISYHAISTIAYQSALESYGVVGLATENFARGIARFFTKEPTSGVIIRYDGDEISVDLFVVIEYGTRISSVADSVANSVKFNIERMVGVIVSDVNVHVRGLRVSDMD
ncbi:MAG: Asp23/Gls24 family envelope stress response protein [Deltaproteobacteria bacterium]|jgi:uncharacterized alkaline shock family protein YloU|nr:Asp23/Gls24 family envelope stress response protein [Deltaproteobacteria bacterium]